MADPLSVATAAITIGKSIYDTVSSVSRGGKKPVDYNANLNSFLTNARQHYEPNSWIKSIGGQSTPEGQEFIRWIEQDFIPSQMHLRFGEGGQDPDWQAVQRKFGALETDYAARIANSATANTQSTLTGAQSAATGTQPDLLLGLSNSLQKLFQDTGEKIASIPSSTGAANIGNNNMQMYLLIGLLLVGGVLIVNRR